MSDSFVTIATFESAAEAELAQQLLTDEGIKAFLADVETVGMLSYVGSALGGIKLQVGSEDQRRARAILARRARGQDESSADDYGHEALETTSIRRARPYAPAIEDDDEFPECPADAMARRAWRAAVIGLFILPPLLNFYSVGLLLQLLWSEDCLTSKGRLALYGALAFDALGFAFGVACWSLFFMMA